MGTGEVKLLRAEKEGKIQNQPTCEIGCLADSDSEYGAPHAPVGSGVKSVFCQPK